MRQPGVVLEQDAFRDQAFVARLGKLLPMLASSQAGEADAARTKLLEHLSHHRLSLSDLVDRLKSPGGSSGSGRASAFGDPRPDLQQALEAARLAENRAHTLVRQNSVLRRKLDQTEMARQKLATRRSHALILGGSGYVFLLAGALAVFGGWLPASSEVQQVRANGPVTVQYSFPPPKLDGSGAAGERTATVLVQDQPVHAEPNGGSAVRTYLPRGTSVVVSRLVRSGGLEWSQVRSDAGSGYIPSVSITR